MILLVQPPTSVILCFPGIAEEPEGGEGCVYALAAAGQSEQAAVLDAAVRLFRLMQRATDRVVSGLLNIRRLLKVRGTVWCSGVQRSRASTLYPCWHVS